MIDPVILRIISLSFALLFLLAAAHKFSNQLHFLANLEAYKILPLSVSGWLAKLIPVLELALGLAWLAQGVLFIQIGFVPLISLMLLAAYTMAIGINLKRGRAYIDCGCSFSSSGSSDNGAADQQLSSGLVLRNLVLIFAILLAELPAADRALLLVDYFGLAVSVVVITLIYGAYNQLLINRNTINSWRQDNA